MPSLETIILAAQRFRAFLHDPKDPTTLYPWTHHGLEKTSRISKRKFEPEYRRRRELLDQMDDLHGQKIDPKSGYVALNLTSWSLLKKAVAHCQKNFSKERILKDCHNESKNDTLLSMPIDLNAPENDCIRRLAMAPEILKPASEYLDGIPALFGAYVWFSPNDKEIDLIGSQLFHFDREDVRQLKCFIPLEEITEDSGPLTVVSANQSRRFMQERKRNKQNMSLKQRFTDGEVRAVTGETQIKTLTGEVGQVLLVDTTNCLHYGSRFASKPKYHITLHYIPAFSRKLYKRNLELTRTGTQANESVEDLLFRYMK